MYALFNIYLKPEQKYKTKYLGVILNKKVPYGRHFLTPGNRWGSNPRPSEPQSDALTN